MSCVLKGMVDTDNPELHGLLKKKGKVLEPIEYDLVSQVMEVI